MIRIKFQEETHSILDKSAAIVSTTLNKLQDQIEIINNSNEQQRLLIKESEYFIRNHYGIPFQNPKLILEKILNND